MSDARPSLPAAIPEPRAEGPHTLVSGIGVGTVAAEQPRVIVLDLPTPAAVVMHVDGPDGAYRTVVLADPRVDREQVDRAVAAAELLEREGVELPRLNLPRQRGSAPPRRTRAARAVVRQLPNAGAALAFLICANLVLAGCCNPL